MHLRLDLALSWAITSNAFEGEELVSNLTNLVGSSMRSIPRN